MLYFLSKNQFKELYISSLLLKKYFLIILFLFSFSSSLFSNSFVFGQSQDTLSINSVSTASSISLDSALVQKTRSDFSIGFGGGLTRARFAIDNPQSNDKNESTIGSVLTIFTNYRINSNFSIQPELAFGRYRSNNTLYQLALLQGTVDYTISTFDLNLLGLYSYSITDWFSISAQAGLSAAYLHNSFGKVIAPNLRLGSNYDVNSDNQFKKLNYGALVGINPSLNFKNVSLQASIRYRHGLNNINSFDYTLNRYLSDSERTIKTRDIIFQIGFLIPIYRGN